MHNCIFFGYNYHELTFYGQRSEYPLAGPGRRFRSDELKSGELLAIGIGMILTVDRKHIFCLNNCASHSRYFSSLL